MLTDAERSVALRSPTSDRRSRATASRTKQVSIPYRPTGPCQERIFGVPDTPTYLRLQPLGA